MDILIKQYTVSDLASAASVLGDAFVTDSLHVAAFGPQRLDQNQLFFQIGLEHIFTNHAHVAFIDNELHGYVHYVASPSCFPPPNQFEVAAETILKPLGDAVPRVVEWFSSWSQHTLPSRTFILARSGCLPKYKGVASERLL